jgi:hypothetical protein
VSDTTLHRGVGCSSSVFAALFAFLRGEDVMAEVTRVDITPPLVVADVGLLRPAGWSAREHPLGRDR